MKSCLVFLGLSIASVVHAGPVDVPNTFQSGTPARAAEVNANFAAVEGAVDDNAERISTLESEVAERLATLESGLLAGGIPIRVGNDVVGRFVTQVFPEVRVDVSGSVGAATELVAQRTAVATTEELILVSNTGYFFGVTATDFAPPPRGAEGTLGPLFLFYVSSDCSGQPYFPVEGPTGFLSNFEPGTGDRFPLRRWYARQGIAFRSPDPTVNEAFMVRRNQTVLQLELNSLYVWAAGLEQAICVDLALLPEYSGPEIHSVVAVEPLDSTETGIPVDMGGRISIGFAP